MYTDFVLNKLFTKTEKHNNSGISSTVVVVVVIVVQYNSVLVY
jgi:hypothetical protein